MTLEHVTSYEEAYTVALIRNECREWMTLDREVLDVKRQKEFYEGLKDRRNIFLFIVREHAEPCGYAVMQIEGKRACLTGGLALPYRGKGLGRQLFTMLIANAQRRRLQPWLEVLKTNERAIGLYKSLGFKTVGSDSRVMLMDYP
jgi:ribosomal protein S18 acetylase RimI-like enzyme